MQMQMKNLVDEAGKMGQAAWKEGGNFLQDPWKVVDPGSAGLLRGIQPAARPRMVVVSRR